MRGLDDGYVNKDVVTTGTYFRQIELIALNQSVFVWNVYDTYWTEMHERLVAYKKQYKSTCVPSIFPKDKQLGVWVHHQRCDYKTKNPTLTIDRIRKLNAIGFVWNTRDTHWMEMYDRLGKYTKEYKTTCVLFFFISSRSATLGEWVHTQNGLIFVPTNPA